MLIFAIIFFLVFYVYLVRPLNHWKKFNVIHTKSLPIFGDNLPGLLGLRSIADLHQIVYNLADDVRFTGYFEMNKPVLCVKDPELLKTIMVKDFDCFLDHKAFVNPEADRLWGYNLVALRAQKWRDMRVRLSPAYTSSKIKIMFELIEKVAENFTKNLMKKQDGDLDVELKDLFSRFTNDVIATTAFGVEVDSLVNRDNEFYLMGVEATSYDSFFQNFKLLSNIIAPKFAKFCNFTFYSPRVSKFFRGLIRDTIKTRETLKIVRPDMIHLLMQTEDKLSLDEITAQALVFFFAGFESVSSTICFALHELAINQSIQDKLRLEILEINHKITYETIQNFKYLEMVVHETLRKWPSFPSTDRHCTKPYTINPTNPKEKPIHLKVGDEVLIPIFAIQRDPKFFPNPSKFDPERFSEENKPKIVPYTFIPFGSGPRNCIGSRFAILEIKVILYHILKEFKIVPNERTKYPLSLHPTAITITAHHGYNYSFKKLQ